MMGIPNEPMSYQGGIINVPSKLFLAATGILMDDGYVKRLERKPGYPVMGLQHTENGLKRAEYLKSRWSYRAKQLKYNWSIRAHYWYGKHGDELIYALIFAILALLIAESLKTMNFCGC
jgi:hypothetical protein